MESVVEAKFRIKLGKTEVEVSKEEAEALYSALFAALNKSIVNWNPISYPVIIREYPAYTPPAKWLSYEVICDTSKNAFYASDTINVRSVN